MINYEIQEQLTLAKIRIAELEALLSAHETARAIQAGKGVPQSVQDYRARQVAAMELADSDGRYLNAQGCQQAITAIDFVVAALAGSQSDSVPKLDKPATIRSTTFGVGVKWSTVIERAQREYEYQKQERNERLAGSQGEWVSPSEWPECSGTPNDCPENEGHGCCKAKSVTSIADECSAISTGHHFSNCGPNGEVQCRYCGEEPTTTPESAHGGRPMTLRECMDAEDGVPDPAAPDGDGCYGCGSKDHSRADCPNADYGSGPLSAGDLRCM